jgi:hypothetical protein
MSTHLHNEMDVIKGYAYYRCRICNETIHNRKTFLARQCMLDNTFIIYFIVALNPLLCFFLYNIKLIKFNMTHVYYYIECHAREVTYRLLMRAYTLWGWHAWIMIILMKSLGHSTCLPSLLKLFVLWLHDKHISEDVFAKIVIIFNFN